MALPDPPISLADFRPILAAKIGALPNPGGGMLEPNPAPQQKTFADTHDTGVLNTEASDHFIEVNAISGGYNTPYSVGGDEANENFNQILIQDGVIFLRRFVNGAQVSDSGAITPDQPLNGRVRLAQKGGLVQVFTGPAGDLVKIIERPMSGFGRFVRAVRQFGGVNTGIIYGGDNIPLTIDSFSLDGDLRIGGALSYTGSPDTWQIQLTSASDAILVDYQDVIVTSASKGAASFLASSPYPASAKGSTVKWRMRQKNVPAVVTPFFSQKIAGPMLYGINMNPTSSFYANVPTADHLSYDWRAATFSGTSLRPMLDADPQVDARGTPIWSKVSGSPSQFILPPVVPGQLMEITWDGDATITLTGNGSSSAPNQVAGTRKLRFNFAYDLVQLVSAPWFVGNPKDDNYLWMAVTPGATPPSNFQCRAINSDGSQVSPGFWSKPYLDEMKAVYGHQSYDYDRPMDLQNIVSLNEVSTTRVTQAGDRSAPTGVSVPDLLDKYEYLGCWGRFNIPGNASEAWVRTEARRAAQWAKRLNRPVVAEWANEVWNVFQRGFHRALAVAQAMGFTGGNDSEKSRKGHSYLHWLYMGWVKDEFDAEGVGNLLIRTVNVQCDNRGNQIDVCESYPGCIDRIDRIEVAPYAGGYAAITPTSITRSDGTYDVDLYISRVRASYLAQHANAKYHRDYAESKGKDFGTYEGGREDTGNDAFARYFALRPEAATLTKEQLDHWDANVGGMYRWYIDNRIPWYGLRQHIAQGRTTQNGIPGSPIWDAWLDHIDATKVAAS